jgi:transposase
VIGKRWLFADMPAGAHASAAIYSLIKAVRANGLEPYTWLRRVLRELQAAQCVEAIEVLLPLNLHRQDLASEMAPWTVWGWWSAYYSSALYDVEPL